MQRRPLILSALAWKTLGRRLPQTRDGYVKAAGEGGGNGKRKKK